MKKSSKEILIGIIFLGVVLVIFVATPFVCLKFCEKSYARFREKNKELVLVNKENNVKKINEDKEYIYFINEDIVNEELFIINKYPIINLNSNDAKNVTLELENLVNEIKINANNEMFLDYGIYETNNYVTLLIKPNNYINSVSNAKSFTFNKINGKLLSFLELLDIYNLKFDDVIREVLLELNSEQKLVDGINIEATINNLNNQENYVIYIDEFDNLLLNFIVKNNFVDYNDTIKINR